MEQWGAAGLPVGAARGVIANDPDEDQHGGRGGIEAEVGVEGKVEQGNTEAQQGGGGKEGDEFHARKNAAPPEKFQTIRPTGRNGRPPGWAAGYGRRKARTSRSSPSFGAGLSRNAAQSRL